MAAPESLTGRNDYGVADVGYERPDIGKVDIPDADLESQINEQLAVRGIESRSAILLEASLFVEDSFREIAIIAGQERPELTFGAKAWLSFLDARNFACQYEGELTTSFVEEIRVRLMSRFQSAGAREFRDDKTFWWGGFADPLTDAQAAAIEENRILTYVPPFDPGEYGVVIYPEVEGQEGARKLRVLQSPLTEAEKVAIDNDPLSVYVARDELPDDDDVPG